jgi:phosphocarrier protein HPr
MIKTNTTISNKLGLHARASAKLTKLAGSFPCEVWMSRGERRINAKSIMGVMMLAAGMGSEVSLETHGEREQECHGRAAGPDRRQVRGRRVTFSPSTAWQSPAASPSGGPCWWRPAGSMWRTISSRLQVEAEIEPGAGRAQCGGR